MKSRDFVIELRDFDNPSGGYPWTSVWYNLGTLTAAVAAASLPADAPSLASWDIAITVSFATLEDCENYRADPAHRRFVEDYLVPRSDVRKAWTFRTEAG